ncbi:MAG: phosphate ABC transporter permease PstA [Cyanobacteria bacterium P01_G01_bin.38]
MDVQDSRAVVGPVAQASKFRQNLSGRYQSDSIFKFAAWGATVIAIAVLAWLLLTILMDGIPTLNWGFISSYPSRKAERAGILAALFGTLWLMAVVAAVAFPVGVGAGIFLEEFATDNWFSRLVEINISNLAGVPSIIYGLLGLTVFVRIFEPITGGRSVLSGGLTLVLLILPVIIVATREALRAVPDSMRLAGFALGATRWQVVWSHVLPSALPGILTGTILALSRAIGETAPLIAIGAVTFIRSTPSGVQSPFTAMPIQIYNWVGRPQAEFHNIAASGIIVLMIVLLLMNAVAVFLRNRFQQAR